MQCLALSLQEGLHTESLAPSQLPVQHSKELSRMAPHPPGRPAAAAAQLTVPQPSGALQAMRSIGPHIVEKFCNIVKLRNRLAKVAGFEDYYDMKVSMGWSGCMIKSAAAINLLAATVDLLVLQPFVTHVGNLRPGLSDNDRG